MNDMNNLSDEGKKVFEKLMKQAGASEPNRIIIPGHEQQHQPDPTEALAMMVQHLEMGLAHVSRTNQVIGTAVDVSRLTNIMIMNMLVEKGIVTKEEMDEKFKVEVIEKFKAMEAEAKEEAEKKMKELQAESKKLTDLGQLEGEQMLRETSGCEECKNCDNSESCEEKDEEE